MTVPDSSIDPRRYVLTLEELAETFGAFTEDIADALGDDAVTETRGRRRVLARPAVRAFLSELGLDYSFRVVAHINMRGGVGKTISSLNLATRALQYGFRTCLLDLDSQGSSSLALGVIANDDTPVFRDIWDAPADDVVKALIHIDEDLWLLPSSLANSMLDTELAEPAVLKRAVANVCRALESRGIDLVVIDCPPSLGAAIISTVCAADVIVIPTASDAFSMRGLEITRQEITAIAQTFQQPPPVVQILYTKYDRRERLSITSLAELQERYPQDLLKSVIRTSSQFSQCIASSETVFASLQRSSARDDYDHYVQLITGINTLSFEMPEE